MDKIQNKMSILLMVFGLVAVGVAKLEKLDNRAENRTALDATRMCAELCADGLGDGKVCKCPANFQPVLRAERSVSPSVKGHQLARKDVCPVLCENGLGEPLCHCKKLKFIAVNRVPNLGKVCDYFCRWHRYHIDGCNVCAEDNNYGRDGKLEYQSDEIDWNAWCMDKCSEGDGGSACNCDILPLSSNLK